jgi:hypothetical protein
VFQERYGNGGIGVVVAFALSEIVVFGGSLYVIRRGTLGLDAALDLLRALAAAGTTLVLFQVSPPIPPWAGIPACIAVFGAASYALGLMRGADISALWALARRRGAAGAPASELS